MAGTAKGLGLFAAGLMAGGVAVALVTPRDGRGMRKAIRKEIRHQRHSAARFARNVADECQAAYDSSLQVAGKLRTLTRRFRAA